MMRLGTTKYQIKLTGVSQSMKIWWPQCTKGNLCLTSIMERWDRDGWGDFKVWRWRTLHRTVMCIMTRNNSQKRFWLTGLCSPDLLKPVAVQSSATCHWSIWHLGLWPTYTMTVAKVWARTKCLTPLFFEAGNCSGMFCGLEASQTSQIVTPAAISRNKWRSLSRTELDMDLCWKPPRNYKIIIGRLGSLAIWRRRFDPCHRHPLSLCLSFVLTAWINPIGLCPV